MYPKVSIITVCRNADSLIEETILSVLHQNYENIEYVIIDGASTDNTCSIINKYIDKITLFISEKDKGIYDAMNKGLNKSTGDWVCFINAGDTFCSPDVLRKVFETSSKQSNYSKCKVIGGNTHLVYPDRIELLKADGPDAFPYKLPYCHQSTLTKRKLFSDDSFQFIRKYKIAADFNLFYQVYRIFSKEAFCTVDIDIANYRMEDSTSFANLRKAKKEYLQITSDCKSIYWWKEYIKYLINK